MEVLEATISEIHAYPLRPEGYAEPLSHSWGSRKEVLEHLAKSSWLWRASEQAASGERRQAEPSSPAYSAYSAHPAPKRRMVRVISRWREVDRWWEPGGGVDAVWRLVELDRGGERVEKEEKEEKEEEEEEEPARAETTG